MLSPVVTHHPTLSCVLKRSTCLTRQPQQQISVKLSVIEANCAARSYSNAHHATCAGARVAVQYSVHLVLAQHSRIARLNLSSHARFALVTF